MRRYGERFEHNLHALRIVESFENPYATFPGLNLTFEVREGIVKHSRDFEPGEIPALDEYLPGLRPPLEAQLIDLCDEIAYNTSDLDDGYFAGLIQSDEARLAVGKIGELDETLEQQFPGAPERVRMHEIVRGLINWLVSGLIEGTMAAAEGARGCRCGSRASRRGWRVSRRETAAGQPGIEELPAAEGVRIRSFGGRPEASASMIASLFEFFLEHPNRLPVNYLEESAGQPSASPGVRLHRRDDGWIPDSHLRADEASNSTLQAALRRSHTPLPACYAWRFRSDGAASVRAGMCWKMRAKSPSQCEN